MKRHLILGLLGTTLLSGCAATAVMVTATTAATTVLYDHRSLRTMYQDQKIVEQASTKLKADRILTGCHFNVASMNHTVLLVGQAQTPAQRARAYTLVKSTPLVRRIYNQVTLTGPLSSVASTNDTWITSKVKASMLQKRGLHSAQIKVLTENGVVYLMGVVSARQATLATQVASRVHGVQKVVRLFEIRHH